MRIRSISRSLKVAVLGVVLCCAVAQATPAFAASAPTVSTGAANQITFASAQLTGDVNAGGTSTSYYFEYGTTTAYGLQTSSASAGSGTTSVSVDQSVTGFKASTLYHYRLVAVNSAGTVTGSDETFTTARVPTPSVSTGSAASINSSSARLTGTVNPNGADTTYYFEYGTTAAYGSRTSTSAAGPGTSSVSVSAVVNGLKASAGYHYRLVAVSSGGTVTGSDRSFSTAKTPHPSVVTGSVTQVATTSVVLPGTVNPNGLSTSYYFQYGSSPSYSSRTPATSTGSGTATVPVSASVTGLNPLSVYHYRLVAVSSAGTATGADHTFTTSPTPLSFQLTAAPDPVRAGGLATVSGTLNGSGAANHQVVLQSRPYPYTADFATIGNAQLTNASGGFSFTALRLATNTQFRVVASGTTPVVSQVVFEGVRLRVSIRERIRRGSHGLTVHLSGFIAPADHSVTVSLQKAVGGRWRFVTRLTPRGYSAGLLSYGRTVRAAHGGRYRISVRPRDGALVRASSRAVMIRRT
jgi:hypothetical protein